MTTLITQGIKRVLAMNTGMGMLFMIPMITNAQKTLLLSSCPSISEYDEIKNHTVTR